MAFELMGEEESVRGDQAYLVRVLFDADTNTQRNEYVLNEETLYHIEFEQHNVQEAENDIDIESIVAGFNEWYDQFGPDWRPEAFYLP